MRASYVFLACLLAVGCGPAISLVSNGGGGGGGGGTTGTVDGGEQLLNDGGVVGCPDSDGTEAAETIVMSQVVFGSEPYIEIFNNSGVNMDLSSFSLQGSWTSLDQTRLAPQERLDNPAAALTPSSGELGLFSGGTVIQYVCWGQVAPSTLQNEAGADGAWLSSDTCAASPPTGESLHLVGQGSEYKNWEVEPQTNFGCAPDAG